MKHIVIGSDNAAVDLKQHIIKLLEFENIPCEDIGVYSVQDQEMYPNIAARAAKRIIDSDYQMEGILLCGTGIGMAIAANKFPGIYAAVCHDIFSAERARLSNNVNIMTMGARIIGIELAKKLVKEWLYLEFKPGSSSPKVEKIKEFEHVNFKG